MQGSTHPVSSSVWLWMQHFYDDHAHIVDEDGDDDNDGKTMIVVRLEFVPLLGTA